jgi:hypothetical protein
MDEKRPVGGQPERAEGHWLVLAYADNPTIRFDARRLDRVLTNDGDLVLTVADAKIVLRVSSGGHIGHQIAESLAPYTRSAPITRQEAYEEAKRQLDVARGISTAPPPPALFFGEDPVRAVDDKLYIGKDCCWIASVERYALLGAEIPLPNGRLQAALASLVIADAARQEDDLKRLSERIKDYESRTSAR